MAARGAIRCLPGGREASRASVPSCSLLAYWSQVAEEAEAPRPFARHDECLGRPSAPDDPSQRSIARRTCPAASHIGTRAGTAAGLFGVRSLMTGEWLRSSSVVSREKRLQRRAAGGPEAAGRPGESGDGGGQASGASGPGRPVVSLAKSH